jgi:hypothetical protein
MAINPNDQNIVNRINQLTGVTGGRQYSTPLPASKIPKPNLAPNIKPTVASADTGIINDLFKKPTVQAATKPVATAPNVDTVVRDLFTKPKLNPVNAAKGLVKGVGYGLAAEAASNVNKKLIADDLSKGAFTDSSSRINDIGTAGRIGAQGVYNTLNDLPATFGVKGSYNGSPAQKFISGVGGYLFAPKNGLAPKEAQPEDEAGKQVGTSSAQVQADLGKPSLTDRLAPKIDSPINELVDDKTNAINTSGRALSQIEPIGNLNIPDDIINPAFQQRKLAPEIYQNPVDSGTIPADSRSAQKPVQQTRRSLAPAGDNTGVFMGDFKLAKGKDANGRTNWEQQPQRVLTINNEFQDMSDPASQAALAQSDANFARSAPRYNSGGQVGGVGPITQVYRGSERTDYAFDENGDSYVVPQKNSELDLKMQDSNRNYGLAAQKAQRDYELDTQKLDLEKQKTKASLTPKPLPPQYAMASDGTIYQTQGEGAVDFNSKLTNKSKLDNQQAWIDYYDQGTTPEQRSIIAKYLQANDPKGWLEFQSKQY